MVRTVANSAAGSGRVRRGLRLAVVTAVAVAVAATPAMAVPARAAAPQPGPACRTIREAGLLVLNSACGLPTVLYAHGAGETVSSPLRGDLLTAVAAAGYSVVMSDMCGPLNWGSACAVDELHRQKQRFSPADPVRVLALSMGGAGLLNYASLHPGDVLMGVGIVPLTTWDTEWLRRATAGAQPALPERVKFAYRLISATDDEIVGPPVVHGPDVSVRRIDGPHEVWQSVPADMVLKALRSPGKD